MVGLLMQGPGDVDLRLGFLAIPRQPSVNPELQAFEFPES